MTLIPLKSSLLNLPKMYEGIYCRQINVFNCCSFQYCKKKKVGRPIYSSEAPRMKVYPWRRRESSTCQNSRIKGYVVIFLADCEPITYLLDLRSAYFTSAISGSKAFLLFSCGVRRVFLSLSHKINQKNKYQHWTWRYWN